MNVMQLVVNTEKNAILHPLQIVISIVEKKNILPILSNILVCKNSEKISFLSTDTEVQITTYTAVGYGNSSINIIVAARKFIDILRSLPETEKVTIYIENKHMLIKSGKSKFTLQTLDAKEYPIMTLNSKYDFEFTLSQKTLKCILNMVYFSIAQQDIRYYLNGLLLSFQKKNIIAVSSDGHRLTYYQVNIDKKFSSCSDIIIPRKTVFTLQRLLENKENPVELKISNNQIKIIFSNIEIISKLIDGKFLDYKYVISNKYEKSFLVNRNKLLRSLQRISIISNDKLKGVRLVIKPNYLKITVSSSNREKASEELEINYNGKDVDIGLNISYLIEILNNLKNENIIISLSDSKSSVLISIPEDNNFQYTLMPMRI
ncbi:DNA polymerase III subunit beta [Candidatus Profftella armatura]|uniref:DNA polymerase III subunit beta n=1 Tax=Candidatus Profftella armatura TaxID=669502 RepID=UPI003D979607